MRTPNPTIAAEERSRMTSVPAIRPLLASRQDVARTIPDGATLAICGSGGGLLEPDHVLEAIEERFLATGHPRDLTVFHSFGIGDRDRKGANRFVHEGMVKRIIASHWSWSPRMMALARENKVEAYSLPAGVMSLLSRETGARRPGVITKTGLGTFVDPRVEGGKVNEISTDELVRVIEIDGEEYLFYPSIPIDFAIVRGSAVDGLGNISFRDEAAALDAFAMALAAYASGGTAVVQVKHRVPTLGNREVDIPASLASVVVHHPDQWQTYVSEYEATLAGALPGEPILEGVPEELTRRIIARRAAMEVPPGVVLNVGFGVSSSVIDCLAESGALGSVTVAIEQGHYGGYPASGTQFGMAHGSQALLSGPDQFDVFASGRLDMTALGMGQVSPDGHVNVSKLAGNNVGPGGFIDISQNANKVIFCGTFTTKGLRARFSSEAGLEITQEGAIAKFVNCVEQITFNGEVARANECEVLYVTERAVFALTAEGLELIEVAPGIDVERDVLAHMEFAPIVRDVRTMPVEVFR